MDKITIAGGLKWAFSGLFGNYAIWFFSLILAAVFWCMCYGALFLFGRHEVMKAPKKKYFFIGVSLLFGIFFGIGIIFCSMMTSVTKHFNQQIEDMRTAAIGREKLGLVASVLMIGPINNKLETPTNDYVTTLQGVSMAPQAKSIQSGIDVAVVLRVSNSGVPTTAWGYKAYITLPGENGREMDAIIPSVLISKSGDVQVLSTVAGPVTLTRDTFLIDALAFNPLATGAAGNFWIAIHINGLKEIPSGTKFTLTFNDVLGRETKIQHVWIPNQ